MYSSLGGRNVLGEDPIMYLSVYLLVYPLLTWAVGGTLMGINTPSQPPQQAPPESGIESGEGLYTPLAEHESPEEQRPPPVWRRYLAALQLGASRLRPVLFSVLQPPVVASLVGIAVAVSPLRALFVDLRAQAGDNMPLQFLADGAQRMGQAAVPINMLILGASLSKGADWKTLSLPLNLSIVFSKMVVMPAVGLCTARALKHYFPGMGGSFYLVVVMETCTPTANNLMVMAELGNQNKQALATSIFTQYLFTPLLLTGSAWLAVTQALDPA
jgi:predicted permease